MGRAAHGGLDGDGRRLPAARSSAARIWSRAASAACTRRSRWSCWRRSGCGPRSSRTTSRSSTSRRTRARTCRRSYMFTAFWGGQAGSMLFWALILVVLLDDRRLDEPRAQPRADAVRDRHARARSRSSSSRRLCFKANPFERLDWLPLDGRGMNPQLQNPGMAIHPPNLYLGYVGDGDSVRVRDRRAHHAAARRGVAGRRAPLGARVAGSSSRSASCSACGGRTSSSAGAATGRGIRSRTRRFLPWLDDDRVPALDHDPGKARHAAQVERRARRRDVPARDLRHVHHAQRRDRERALVRAVAGRELVRRASSSSRSA